MGTPILSTASLIMIFSPNCKQRLLHGVPTSRCHGVLPSRPFRCLAIAFAANSGIHISSGSLSRNTLPSLASKAVLTDLICAFTWRTAGSAWLGAWSPTGMDFGTASTSGQAAAALFLRKSMAGSLSLKLTNPSPQ